MTPNNPIPKEKQDRIPVLLEKHSIGKTAKELNVSRQTVKKYDDDRTRGM